MVDAVGGSGTGNTNYRGRHSSAMPGLDYLAARSFANGQRHGQKRQKNQTNPRYGDVVEISVAGLWDLAQQRMDALPLDMNPDGWAAEMDKLNNVFTALHKLEAAGVERIRPNVGEGLIEATTRVAASLPEPKVEAATGLASLKKVASTGIRQEVGLDTLRQQFWKDLSRTLTALGEKTGDTPMKPGPDLPPEQPLTYEHLVKGRGNKPVVHGSTPKSAPLHGDLPDRMRQLMAAKAYGEMSAKPSPFQQPTLSATPEQLGGQPELSDEDRLYWEKCKRRLFEGLYALRLLREKGVTKLALPKDASLVDAAKTALKAHGINGVDYDPEKHHPATPGL
ncbi:MAG: hypothetical protein Alpg2KO_13610 [Alphaproteobacteria bacterium]